MRLLWVLAGVGAFGQLLAWVGLASNFFTPDLLFTHPFLATSTAGSYVLYAIGERRSRDHLFVLALAAAVALLIWTSSVERLESSLSSMLAVGNGLGIAAIGVGIIRAGVARGAERTDELARLLPRLLLPLFAVISLPFLHLTTILWPETLDARVYALDATFGTQLSFDFGLLFANLPSLEGLAQVVYLGLPVGLAFVYAMQRRLPDQRDGDVLTSFYWMAGAGYVLYFLFPVVGPTYIYGAWFPDAPPSVEQVMALSSLAPPAPRNCVPSLHTAWALLVWWHARPLATWARGVAGFFLAVTLLATLGFGFHYVYDLVVAFPFALAVHAASMRDAEPQARTRAVAAGGALTVVWLALIWLGPPLFSLSPVIPWVASLWTVTITMVLESRLHPESRWLPTPPSTRARLTPLGAGVAAVFFLSGTAALVYQVVFAKWLTLAFGSTATATVVVLATYMAGLAGGSWLGGRVASRLTRLVRAYALAELGIALWCGMAPWTLDLAQSFYVSVATGMDPSDGTIVVLQLALGAAMLTPPTLLMGFTMPLLTRHFAERDDTLGTAVGLLYGINTLGAATGAILTGYLLMPTLGVTRSLLVAVGINLVVAVVAIILDLRVSPEAPIARRAEPLAPEVMVSATQSERRVGIVAVVVLTVGGAVTFGLETTYTHLLAVVAGNSTYAFSLMLFSFLLGLGGGSTVSRRLLRRGVDAPMALGIALGGLAASVLLGVYVWDAIPGYFASFAPYPAARTFAEREFVRFVVCVVSMLPPALFIGANYPLAMECIGRAWPRTQIAAMGRSAALNTLGNIAGALLVGFWLMPLVGSLRTLQILAGSVIALSALLLIAPGHRRRTTIAAVATTAALLLVLSPSHFDLTRLASGANVYFHAQSYGRVIDHAESMDGGLTTVATSVDRSGAEVLTLLTNGKFQGDDSLEREVKAQAAFVLVPLLHTPSRRDALVIGLGTGVSANVLHQAGFEHLDVIELSEDIVRLTDRYFRSVNGNVLNQAGVQVHITDGRNFLLLQSQRYDLISMEISSIWFAGAASLYNREFYEIAARRLTETGVLQQWIQLHHIAMTDVLSILASVRSVFEAAWLYFIGNQGIIVACNHDCLPRPETLWALENASGLEETLGLFSEGASTILRGRLLDPAAVDALLDEAGDQGLPRTELVSTDDNLLLEYSTPRGNVRPYAESLRGNYERLDQFRPDSLLVGTDLEPGDVHVTGIPGGE